MNLIQNHQLVQMVAKIEFRLLQLGAILLRLEIKVDKRQATCFCALQSQRCLAPLMRWQGWKHPPSSIPCIDG